jgi:serine/threonine protein phosphatase PrpC
LGSDHEPQIDQFRLKLESGDIVLLCSDGLTRHLSDEDIAELLIGSPASKAATELIQLANERGGKDNISVAVIRYWPGEKKKTMAAAGSASSKAFLWVFTAILSILQSAGIFFVWLKLFT